MTFLGMGTLEILIVLLVAFIFLGPERMIDAARSLGKVVAEIRRMAADLPELVIEEDDTAPLRATRSHDSSPRERRDTGRAPTSESAQAEESPDDEDAPVAFRSAQAARTHHDDKVEPTQEQK